MAGQPAGTHPPHVGTARSFKGECGVVFTFPAGGPRCRWPPRRSPCKPRTALPHQRTVLRNVCTGLALGKRKGTHDLSRLPSLLGGLAGLLRGDKDFPRLLTWVGEWELAGFKIWGRCKGLVMVLVLKGPTSTPSYSTGCCKPLATTSLRCSGQWGTNLTVSWQALSSGHPRMMGHPVTETEQSIKCIRYD